MRRDLEGEAFMNEVAFNSLFEMPGICVEVKSARAVRAAFNSLFEMRSRRQALCSATR